MGILINITMNHLYLIDQPNYFDETLIADGTTSLSLKFLVILSIRNISIVVGEIGNEKLRNKFGFFDRIMFRNTEYSRGNT